MLQLQLYVSYKNAKCLPLWGYFSPTSAKSTQIESTMDAELIEAAVALVKAYS